MFEAPPRSYRTVSESVRATAKETRSICLQYLEGLNCAQRTEEGHSRCISVPSYRLLFLTLYCTRGRCVLVRNLIIPLSSNAETINIHSAVTTTAGSLYNRCFPNPYLAFLDTPALVYTADTGSF
jgi:hypothetical protein